jgi:ParB family chromosome partitioning protein
MFQEIALSKIKPNPLNPRKRFEGPRFEELVASIKAKDVLQPVLVRPKGKHFELVAGERRFRAKCLIAEADGGLAKNTIPAMVREMSDDDAFDAMTIENLQREDLSPLEEAEAFKAYLDKRGEESLDELAQRISKHPGYIRRRTAVLSLPKNVLKAWNDGRLVYGHLEQLIRIRDKKCLAGFIGDLLDDRFGNWSVRELKKKIDEQSPALANACWDLEAEGCHACQNNSDAQKKLFADESKNPPLCLKPACFKQKFNNWLSANWKQSAYAKQLKTNGFRFREGLGYNDFTVIYGGLPAKDCKKCPDLVTIINDDGRKNQDRACMNPACLKAKEKSPNRIAAKKDPDAPRVAWHGEYFREKFYQASLPQRFKQEAPDQAPALRLGIFSLLKSNHDLLPWYKKQISKPSAPATDPTPGTCRTCGCTDNNCHACIEITGHPCTWIEPDLCSRCADEMDEDPRDSMGGYWMGDKDIFAPLVAMDDRQLLILLQEASIQVSMQQGFGPQARRIIADHIGIDLKAEWRIDEEYLAKKTKAEILALMDKFQVKENPAVQTYLYEKLLKKRGKFDGCKKGELVELILKSGIDLAGIVPDEILSEK